VCKFIKENLCKTILCKKINYRIFIYLNMKLSTTNDIAGHSVAETIGIARGSTVRTRNVGNDILAAFKNLVGGEVAEYTRLQADAREQALQRMIEDANNLGADAVICIRFQTSVMMAGASELLAYGTAVKLK
jgi:uncharacterized protein YbjQ (UPF0145 family)